MPTLRGGSGFYYVIKAKGGAISANWKLSGGAAQLFLYQAVPFGEGSGIGGVPLGGALAQSNINASSVSIVPIDVPAGTYTLYFYSGAINDVKTASASATYVAQSAPTMTPTPSPSATATIMATATPSSATPTATPIPESSATPTSTPVPPSTTTTPYP